MSSATLKPVDAWAVTTSEMNVVRSIVDGRYCVYDDLYFAEQKRLGCVNVSLLPYGIVPVTIAPREEWIECSKALPTEGLDPDGEIVWCMVLYEDGTYQPREAFEVQPDHDWESCPATHWFYIRLPATPAEVKS